MNVLARLALLFVVVPIIELAILVRLGQYIGFWPTLGLVVFTGVTGAAMARLEGTRVLFKFQQQLATGHLPGQALLDGVSILIGGALLLTPGVLTDVVGFSLLFPLSRRWIQRRVRKRLESKLKDGTIRVVSMHAGRGAFGGWGRSQADPEGTGPDLEGSPPDLDPRKGIVIPDDEE